jgi:hypothetical protein
VQSPCWTSWERVPDTVVMHVVTVTFEKIFDLHRWDRSKYVPRHTAFGFVANGESRYSVSVVGWPTIEVGTTVTAFLGEEGNWQSLVGWVNHQTREVVIPNYQRSIYSACVSSLIALFIWMGPLSAGAPNLSSAGNAFAYASFFALALLTLVLASQSYQQLREAKVVQAFAASLDQRLTPTTRSQ